MNDSEIIELYTARNENAVTQTDLKYGRYCRYIAFNILKNDEDSEECVNDTYLRAWNSIPPKHPENLKTYLGKITRNLSLNRFEKLSSKKRGSGQIPLILDELSECIPDSKNTETAVEDTIVTEIINRFLDGLSPETRKIFVRRYWYMSTVRDIANDYGFTQSKVTVTLFRTREKLKKVLEKEGVSL